MPKTCPQCQSIHSGVAVRCGCGADLSRVASAGPIAIPPPTAPEEGERSKQRTINRLVAAFLLASLVANAYQFTALNNARAETEKLIASEHESARSFAEAINQNQYAYSQKLQRETDECIALVIQSLSPEERKRLLERLEQRMKAEPSRDDPFHPDLRSKFTFMSRRLQESRGEESGQKP